MKKLFALFLSFIVLINALVINADAAHIPPPTVSAESAVLIDLESRAVLFEHNMSKRLGMASTTKIMTALIAAERSELSELVKIPSEAIGVEGSSIYLSHGEALTMEELLFALLLQSANDAATAIAIAVAGSVEAFADMMNDRAAQMGLEDTHFTNPHGLYDEEHYTTAYDLAIISAHALENETISRIFATYKATLPITSESQKRVLVNHNKLLRLYRGTIGVKTGFTKRTGRCLVSAAERGGLTLVAVTLNAPNDWRDHMGMLDFGFANFERVTVLPAGAFSYAMPAVGGAREALTLTNEEDIKMTLPRERDDVKFRIDTLHRFEFAPIYRGTELGRVYCSYKDKFFAESALICAADLPKAASERSWLSKIFDIFT